MQYKDYYKILGLQRDASAKDIKRAYQKLAHKYHPDISRTKNTEEKFKEINEAYKVLKNPQKRADFDRLEDQQEADWQARHKPPENQEFKVAPEKQPFEAPPIRWLLGILLVIYPFTSNMRALVGSLIAILIMIYIISEL